jgi:hypothetical protein
LLAVEAGTLMVGLANRCCPLEQSSREPTTRRFRRQTIKAAEFQGKHMTININTARQNKVLILRLLLD